MPKESKYLFGPVLSRRLGLSLGVDIVPFKTCTLDCIYCQLGAAFRKTIERKVYVAAEPVLAELEDKLSKDVQADFITISGSGEPTLNSQLGRIVDAIKQITNIPVAIITNGTLLYRADVRADCAKADVVLPSLDAADMKTFGKINRPHKDIDVEMLVSGLCKFRQEFTGQIWLEVFLVDGVNTDHEQIAGLTELITRISPDKVQLNTAVRPGTEKNVCKVPEEKLRAIAAKLSPNSDIIADFSPQRHTASTSQSQIREEAVLSMLMRRPCSLDDVSSALDFDREETGKLISVLQHRGLVESQYIEGMEFFIPIRSQSR